MDEEYNTEHPKRHRRLRVGRLLLVLLLLTVAVSGCFWLGQTIYKLFATPVVPVTVANDETLLDETLNRRINVLILGIDDGDSEDFEGPKRTDAMLVASFDPDHNEVALVSIPRDTRVQIPGRVGLDKINHAHAYGGVLLAKQTVANLLKIPIHYYVLLNWQGFIDVINIIGGVDMYVEDNMNYEDPYADLKIHITKGYQHLDGKLAGEYVRFRSDELGDIGRVQRQQRFLKALASEFFNLTNVIKLPTLVTTVEQHIKTDMDALTMIKTINSFKIFGGEKVKSEMLYGKFETINDISYWVTTPTETARTLAELKIPYQKMQE
ncbi:MAG: LCP family protein [Acidaminococcaceae bacterium]